MNKSRVLLSSVLGLAICGLLAASAHATSQTHISHLFMVPGVDHHGNLDMSLGAKCRFKVIYNTKDRTFCAKSKCEVTNYSCKPQAYYNRMAVALRPMAEELNIPLNRISITEDVYRVDAGFFYCAYGSGTVCGRIGAIAG